MTPYKIGQRWISQMEPQLGLGTLVSLEGRRVGIRFESTEEDRYYAADTAPLSRIRFAVGDQVELSDGTAITLTQAEEQKQLMFYAGLDENGQEHVFPEIRLSGRIRLNSPEQRLLSGLTDRLSAYRLRLDALNYRARLLQSPVRGLLGSRSALLPHQVWIAHTVASRPAPRVLLADEVGLGKTIEAGMILHQQIITGLARRVLIAVPESLVTQWLVEMLRRFNLSFTLMDAERFEALREAGEDNPFDTQPLILCSRDWLTGEADVAACAATADWDMLIIDEAHHLHWHPDGASPAYAAIEPIARRSRGVLLLTATPEQAGIEGHFARLRLLDPARFPDLERFREEEGRFAEVAPVAQALAEWTATIAASAQAPAPSEQPDPPMSWPDLPASLDEQLERWLPARERAGRSPAQWLDDLLDRYGTGRVLFRNVRAQVGGFPERRLHAWPLACPAGYEIPTGPAGLTPECEYGQSRWLKEDPRVAWLEQHLKGLRPEKVLVICRHADTAIALEAWLELRCGIPGAVFHEGMTLLERDRAAAWFAETDDGAQVLVCSEMGSEGRNFQFVHHLVLFDLPLNPDLLEQRIGRLDRIGQRFPVNIHVPYLQGSPQEVLFRWYDEGYNLFRECLPGVSALQEQLQTHLDLALQAGHLAPDSLQQARHLAEGLRQSAAVGRDPLLELSSNRPAQAEQLIEAIEDTENGRALRDFMEDLCDHFGVHYEEHSLHSLVLRPTDAMPTGHFPGLTDEDGITVTFSREQALNREDLQFLSWEHPIVDEAIDMLLCGELGRTTLVSLKLNGVAPGTLLLEAIYTPFVVAAPHHPVSRFLPPLPIRILCDQRGRSLGHVLSSQQLDDLCIPLKRATIPQIVREIRGDVRDLLNQARQLAQSELPNLQAQARTRLEDQWGRERDRLLALQRVNPSIRDEEIHWYTEGLTETRQRVDAAELVLDAARLIIVGQ